MNRPFIDKTDYLEIFMMTIVLLLAFGACVYSEYTPSSEK